MILYIDTTEKEKIFLAKFKDKEHWIRQEIKIRSFKKERLLFYIARILEDKEKNISPRDALKKINGIIVVKGPGPFSSVRSGIVIANILSYALKVPVIGVDKNFLKSNGTIQVILKKFKFSYKKKFVRPYYKLQPNITT